MPTNTNSLSRSAWKEVFETTIAPRIPGGTHAWSIAELGLSDEAYQSLIAVFAEMTGLDWEILAYGARDDRERAGLLLVVVMAEHARRHTRGDQIWTCMRNLPMRDCLRRRFFLINGQPTRDLRVAIESAAYRWNLRHVFNIPGHMSWFVTLFLQFGFPLPAAERRLPFWLSGQILPVAVSYLQGGGMLSPSFVLMWQSLRAYRLNHITESKCQSALERSPWIRPDWIPVLMKLAKTRLDLVDRDEAGEGEEAEPLILGDPCLIWPTGEEPFFRCEILATATFELKEACYEIQSVSCNPVRLLRQDDEIYHIVGDPWVDFALGRASTQCTLVAFTPGAGEEDVANQSVSFWDPHYPITLYRKSKGIRMSDPECPVRLDEGSFAVFHSSFTIEPQAVRLHEHHDWWFAELPACGPDQPALLQDGERVWWPEETTVQQGGALAVSITARHTEAIEWTSPDLKPEIEFRISLPLGAELRWVRIGHEVLDFESEGNHRYRTGAFKLRPEHAVYPLYATVGFSAGGRLHRTTQRVTLNLLACFLESEGRLEVYDPSRALNTRNARRFLFHILCPEPEAENAGRRVWVLEGSRAVLPVGKRSLQLTHLAGYGEPLDLYRGLYNTDHKLLRIVSRVRDNGVVKKAIFNAHGFYFSTCTAIELDGEHEVIAWTSDHRFLRFAANDLIPEEKEGKWFCDLTRWQDEEHRNPPIQAIAFFYQGHLLGNWFSTNYFYTITKVHTDEEAARCAEMLRWFKAPLLDSETRPAMIYLLRRYLGEVIPVWLSAGESPELQLPGMPVDEAWLQVVNLLCRDVGFGNLTLPEASQIVEDLFPDFSLTDLVNSLPKALANLEGISPNLIAKIAHLYLTEVREGRLPGNADGLKRAILSRFEVSKDDLDSLGGKLGVDPFFLESALARMLNSGAAHASEQHNRDLLLNHRLLRQSLAYRYLSRL